MCPNCCVNVGSGAQSPLGTIEKKKVFCCSLSFSSLMALTVELSQLTRNRHHPRWNLSRYLEITALASKRKMSWVKEIWDATSDKLSFIERKPCAYPKNLKDLMEKTQSPKLFWNRCDSFEDLNQIKTNENQWRFLLFYTQSLKRCYIN